MSDRYADASGVEDFKELSETPSAGDEAVAFTYNQEQLTPQRTLYHHVTYVRHGDIVARTDILGITALEEAASAGVADAQAECLADGDCSDPIEVPAEPCAKGESGSTEAADTSLVSYLRTWRRQSPSRPADHS